MLDFSRYCGITLWQTIVLLLKLFLVPTFIAMIAISGRLWGASVAGLLSGLPVIAGPIVWFIYLDNGLVFAQNTAIAAVGGIIALSTFCFSYSWLCSHLSWKRALFLSLAIYLVIALLIGNSGLSLGVSTLLALVVILFQIYLSPELENRLLLAPASNAEIMCRMAFAFALVLGVTSFTNVLGETYSGIFAVFPIAGSTIALFSHRNYSSAHAARSLKSMKQGLLSMLVFFYVVAVASSKVEFSVALLSAAGAGLLSQAIVVLIKKNIVRKRQLS